MTAEVTTDCTTCKYAEWKRKKDGALHPSGDGKCIRLIAHPLDLRIPPAFWWHTVDADRDCAPRPTGGWISRRERTKGKCAFKEGIQR